MRLAPVRWLAVLAVGAGLCALVLWMATTLDARPPMVDEWRLTQHLSGDERVALTTTGIEVTFDEPVNHPSAERAFEIEPPVEGTFSWAGPTLLFTPSQPLPLETSFTVRIGAGVRDLAGNEVDEPSEAFAFATTGPPAVAESDPADGASAVPLDAPLVITFTTLMDTGSVERALEVEPFMAYDLRWDGELLTVLPTRPLRPDTEYMVRFEEGATDLAGIALESGAEIRFRTQTGLRASALVPAEGSEGVAIGSPIALVFDVALDPDSVEQELLTITPPVPGLLTVGSLPAAGGDQDEPRVLRFDPAGPLPPNTTFEVEVGTTLRAADGGQLVEPVAWRFTTGAPTATLGNQVTFLADRAGIGNLWAMNPDGSNQRQLSAELAPVTDYALAPDGRGFVVTDGARLVLYAADGTNRRVLTEGDVVEFDPAYAPDGRSILFARADAETGRSLGIWRRGVDGGGATRIEVPGGLASPSPGPGAGEQPVLRAPRLAPDGEALALVIGSEAVGILDLDGGELLRVPFRAVSPPVWLPDGRALLVAGLLEPEPGPVGVSPPVSPLDAGSVAVNAAALGELVLAEVPRDGSRPRVLYADGIGRPTVGGHGRIAFIRLTEADAAAGELWVTGEDGQTPTRLLDRSPLTVTAAVFAPEPGALLVARQRPTGDGGFESAGIWHLSLADGRVRRLSADGEAPRWLP